MTAKIVNLLRLAQTELPGPQSLQGPSAPAASSAQSKTPVSAQVSALGPTNRPINDRRKH